jgi:hypothetical protein
MNELVVECYRDERDCSFTIRIHDGLRFVLIHVYDEAIVAAEDYQDVMRNAFRDLCNEWLRRHGRAIKAIEPTEEGTFWSVEYDDTIIDGEVVEERKALGA